MTIYCLYIFDRYAQPSFPPRARVHNSCSLYLKNLNPQTQALQLRLLPRLAIPHQASKARQRRRRAPPRRLARPRAPPAGSSLIDLRLRHTRARALLQPAQHPLLDLGRPRRVRRRQPAPDPAHAAAAIVIVIVSNYYHRCCVGRGPAF